MLLTAVAADGGQRPADISESPGERRALTTDDAEEESDGRNDSTSADLTPALNCHKTLTAAAAADADDDSLYLIDEHLADCSADDTKAKKSCESQNAKSSKDDNSDKNDTAGDEDSVDTDDDNQVFIIQ